MYKNLCAKNENVSSSYFDEVYKKDTFCIQFIHDKEFYLKKQSFPKDFLFKFNVGFTSVDFLMYNVKFSLWFITTLLQVLLEIRQRNSKSKSFCMHSFG